jgi:hypothetical protein
MDDIIAKIGRKNHVSHLISVMPLITLVYGIQCYLIFKFSDGMPVGDYALLLGCSLAFFISFLIYYDNQHHVFICRNHLHIYFPLFGTNLEIKYDSIEEIIAPTEECNFSTIIIKTKEKNNHVIYFVDFPVSVKMIIEEQMKSAKNDHHNDFNKAA